MKNENDAIRNRIVFVLPVMLTGHIPPYWKWNKLKFPCCSVVFSCYVASRCVLRNFDRNPGWNPTRTVVYYSRTETDIGVHALPVTKLKMKYSCYQDSAVIHGWFVYCAFGWEIHSLSKSLEIRFRMGSFSQMSLLTCPCSRRKRVEKYQAILASLDGLQEQHLDSAVAW